MYICTGTAAHKAKTSKFIETTISTIDRGAAGHIPDIGDGGTEL